MKKPGRLIAVVCFACLLVCSGANGSGFPKPPKSAAAREELVQHFGATIGFGHVVKWEFTTAGHELIVFSYCPTSGRAACYVHAYYRSRAKQPWVLFIDRLIEPAKYPKDHTQAAAPSSESSEQSVQEEDLPPHM
jgi:hypothetical protein